MGIVRNEQFLTLNEHKEICEAIDTMDAQFTDDVEANAEFYDIEEDPITLEIRVTVYDESGGVLATATVEDYDVAVAYLEDRFELDPLEDDDVDDEALASSTRYGQGS